MEVVVCAIVGLLGVAGGFLLGLRRRGGPEQALDDLLFRRRLLTLVERGDKLLATAEQVFLHGGPRGGAAKPDPLALVGEVLGGLMAGPQRGRNGEPDKPSSGD